MHSEGMQIAVMDRESLRYLCSTIAHSFNCIECGKMDAKAELECSWCGGSTAKQSRGGGAGRRR